MKLLRDVLYGVGIKSVLGMTDINIKSIQFDSRKIIEKDLFVAIRGVNVDGHDFINTAIEKGAIVIVHEKELDKMVEGVAYVKVKNSSKALAIMASNYYDYPSNNLQLIGVTGTNGKTTVTTLLYDLFISAGYKVGLISTVKIMVDNKRFNTTHTTPDPILINYYLSQNNLNNKLYQTS